MPVNNKERKFLFVFLLTPILVLSLAPAGWARKPIQFKPSQKIKVDVTPGESVFTTAKFVSSRNFAKLKVQVTKHLPAHPGHHIL